MSAKPPLATSNRRRSFHIVVHLTVVDDYGSILALHRLRPRNAEVDDAEATVGETSRSAREHDRTLIIRSPVGEEPASSPRVCIRVPLLARPLVKRFLRFRTYVETPFSSFSTACFGNQSHHIRPPAVRPYPFTTESCERSISTSTRQRVLLGHPHDAPTTYRGSRYATVTNQKQTVTFKTQSSTTMRVSPTRGRARNSTPKYTLSLPSPPPSASLKKPESPPAPPNFHA